MKMWSDWNSHMPLVGMQEGITTLEFHRFLMTISYFPVLGDENISTLSSLLPHPKFYQLSFYFVDVATICNLASMMKSTMLRT